MLDGFDPSTIQDPALRQVVQSLMNQLEALYAKVQAQAAEIQRLRDENNHLKGEQGKPDIKPNKVAHQLSSEAERAIPKPRRKQAKCARLRIDRELVVPLDHSALPADAQFKGYRRVVVQDIVLTTDTVRLLKAKYYSPSEHRTYVAAPPPGYEGQFGPGLKALVLTLYFDSGMSEPIIRSLLTQAGVQISTGQLSNLLIAHQERFHQERAAILAAGLHSSPWQHIDTTSTRVDGTNQQCHVLCNPLYTAYTTLPQRDRLHILDVLRGGTPRSFRLDASAERLMRLMDVPARDQRKLAQLPRDQDLSEAVLEDFLATYGKGITELRRKWIKDSLAIAAYHAQRDSPFPIVHTLVCDDAPQWTMLTEAVALCWVHDGRHYKKLEPRLAYHRQLVADFLKEYWEYYRELLSYREQPSAAEAERLRAKFDRLFATVSGYGALDERIRITRDKRRGLLMVLSHPELPLHNNPAELGARRRVRKRDISFGPQNARGAAAWDTFQTLAATAQKLGIRFYDYVRDRICQGRGFPRLADLITERAEDLHLGGSWKTASPRPVWKPVQVHCWHS
jgi:transposase IS66 family protein